MGKKGVRCLGVAESFRLGGPPKSVFAGVVMRKDLLIDGAALSLATVGGDDATDAVLDLYGQLAREDVGFLMVSGAIVSWFNFVDPERIWRETGRPVIVLTYRASRGLEGVIRSRFGDRWEEKLEAYRRLGPRERVELHTGFRVYVRSAGLSDREVVRALNDFTIQGRYPEPVRVAGLLARAALRLMEGIQHQPPLDRGAGRPPVQSSRSRDGARGPWTIPPPSRDAQGSRPPRAGRCARRLGP
ncbi:MAG: DUF99 family protein [Thaumarchaeota archaeon]|nr:DUF99 family protein [Nitrososphaerota archaeon]